MQIIKGNIVDIQSRKIYSGSVVVESGKIKSISAAGDENKSMPYIIPGFIDSHVHIESSMLVPSEFARLAVVHGTVGTISDPHEIANVCGIEGVRFMIENSRQTPFKCRFGAPSCVPATAFETAGAVISSAQVDELLSQPDILYLSEMMNFPGVLMQDTTVMEKIAHARKHNKPVDGHAPGLRGEQAKKYIDAGISTDHECFTAAEALDKLGYGMKILIREGSAAKNFDALIELLHDYPGEIMFCSDDKHPDSLADGHINQLCARAVKKGIDVFKVLQAACINPVKHYRMDVGLLQEGDAADFVLVNNLTQFEVQQTFINGTLVAENGKSLLDPPAPGLINKFNRTGLTENDFSIAWQAESTIDVIGALDGQLITEKLTAAPVVEDGFMVSNVQQDLIKIVVVNRYHPAPVAKAFIKNTGLKKGALASSVAHDSHNIVAIGTNDKDLCAAVNAVIKAGGGVSAAHDATTHCLALPVAGLMSNENGYEVAAAYTKIDRYSKEVLGSTLSAPFMTLSFMALLVIPHLKLSDKGLFDGDNFRLV